MPLSATNFVTKGPVLHADMLQFFNLFTGVMLDQPVTFKNTLTLGGNQGSSTVPLKIYGAVGQTSHLLDLYADTGQAQPGFGFGAAGNFGWGPGGASPQDTFLSRVATQNGHASDTAGLLVQPYLEVAGPIQANSYQFANGAVLTGPGANPFQLLVNQDLKVNRSVGVGLDPLSASGAGSLIVQNYLQVGVIQTNPNPGGTALQVSHMTGGNSTAIAIPDGAVFTQTATSGAVAGILTFGTARATANNSVMYGGYYAPKWSSNGFTGHTGIGMAFYIQPGDSGVVNMRGVHIGQVSGGSSTNYGLLVDAPSGSNPYSIVAAGACSINNVIFSGGGDISGAKSVGASGNIYSTGGSVYAQGGEVQAAGWFRLVAPAASGLGIYHQPVGQGIEFLSSGPFGAGAYSYPGGAKMFAPFANTWLVQSAPAGNTTSTSLVAAPSPFNSISLSGAYGRPIMVWGCINMYHDALNAQGMVGVAFNGGSAIIAGVNHSGQAGGSFSVPFCHLAPGGTNSIQITWATNTGTLRWNTGVYSFVVACEIY